MKFELIDQVIERDGDRLKAVKAVTAAEEYLADHFPGYPILPGVLMLEALVQAARQWTLGLDESDRPAWPLVMSEVRNVRYAAMVRPGQCLALDVSLRKREGQTFQFQATGTVEGESAVQARFTLSPLPNPTTPSPTPPRIGPNQTEPQQ